jgi:YgiT-type zinc finger domain-containing protein
MVQPCPDCKTDSAPETVTIIYTLKGGARIPVAIQRYKCPGCGWIWGTREQRRHNEREYKRSSTVHHWQGV